ncbi:DNA-binding transcriptional LysR family regulator [Luteibacter sp. Sphag1AF]|uniref:LysR family transcriptional regulator n=1 Tax=Luteibacter sp. Sphag1AF TaxID=2587031 RepID=UPI00160E7799|nr:LysR family transcriptional regulator [Luteibacter sp. Sphag1AF]MBB3228239.1 DNA-binding transcriptional LysR family regulator [Luteibacter sp. Sphag1AF]
MDTISNLNVFVQVARARSMVAASRQLGVSASAVGKAVARLEQRLGVRLFNRSTRSVTLTEEGTYFLERCERILHEIESAEEAFSETMGSPRGTLKVSMPLVGDPFLPVLAAFRTAYPEVELELNFEDRRVDVIEEGYDAVIRAGDVPDSRLTARTLGEYRMILVGSPGYFARHPAPTRVQELSSHSCIQFRFPNTGKLQEWPLGQDEVVHLPPSVVCNSFEARITLAVADVGIACLPEFAARRWLDEGKLVQVLPECSSTGLYRIMWPSGRHPVPKIRAFVDYLCEHLFKT